MVHAPEYTESVNRLSNIEGKSMSLLAKSAEGYAIRLLKIFGLATIYPVNPEH